MHDHEYSYSPEGDYLYIDDLPYARTVTFVGVTALAAILAWFAVTASPAPSCPAASPDTTTTTTIETTTTVTPTTITPTHTSCTDIRDDHNSIVCPPMLHPDNLGQSGNNF